MSGEERRKEIIRALESGGEPLSGTGLAKEFDVSRQIIVQDIALLRAAGYAILSTNRGYILQGDPRCQRVFKMHHTPDDCEDELNVIVDLGGAVEDIFIYHKYYGVVKADMHIRSRRDVAGFMEDIRTGKSTLLSTATSGYHYHTVSAESQQVLDDIQAELAKKGFLAKLQDFEPVDFWKNSEEEKK